MKNLIITALLCSVGVASAAAANGQHQHAAGRGVIPPRRRALHAKKNHHAAAPAAVDIGLNLNLLAPAADEVVYRPPAVPIVDVGPHQQKFVDADLSINEAKFWDSTNPMPTTVYLRCHPTGANSHAEATFYPLVGSPSIFTTNPKIELLTQVGFARVEATTTRYEFVPQSAAANPYFDSVHVEFTTPRIISDPHLLSWPVTYVHAQIGHKKGENTIPSCRMYVESTGQNAAHLLNIPAQTIKVEEHSRDGEHGHHIRFGTPEQNVLGSDGDDFMLNWGHQYMSVHGDKKTGEYHEVTGGAVKDVRDYFAQKGEAMPFVAADQTAIPYADAGIAAVVGPRRRESVGDRSEFHVLISYDEVKAQYYFGQEIVPRWRCAVIGQDERCFNHMHALLQDAWRDWDEVRTVAKQFDRSLDRDVRQLGLGEHYLKIAHNAYRQTIAANNMGYAPGYPKSTTGSNYWIFQKEISSDGDVNTMDVIFPSSPLYLHYNPGLLRDMLVPVIQYALNKTWSKYTEPYSPHQLGTYPVANITMPEQEVMPLENTGNMFLMLYGLLKADGFNATKASYFYPAAWPMFTTWADAMIADQLPFPPHQTCTDDFSGPTTNNTNLAAKGIISLHAYARMCEILNPTQTSPNPCSYYKDKARQFAKTFVDVGYAMDSTVGFAHTKLFFNSEANTWSTKYNFLWQKLLEMDGPFTADEDRMIREAEAKLYLIKAKENVYGFPLDSRFTFQKLDWMTWAFCMDDKVENFKQNFADYAFKMANETSIRYPLTDLFDVKNAFPDFFFRSRPVVGALFAPLIIYKQK